MTIATLLRSGSLTVSEFQGGVMYVFIDSYVNTEGSKNKYKNEDSRNKNIEIKYKVVRL